MRKVTIFILFALATPEPGAQSAIAQTSKSNNTSNKTTRVQQPSALLESHGKETEEQKETRAKHPGNLVGHGGPIKTIAISPSGNYALTGSFDYGMIHWDLSQKSPKIIHRYDEHAAPVSAVAFLTEEDKALSAGDDGVLSLWDLKSKNLIKEFKEHQSKIVGVTISDDGHVAATASWDRTVRLWNLKDLKPGPKLQGHQGPVNAVAFAEYEGRPVLYSASYDGTIRRWNAKTGEFERQLYKHGWGLNVLKVIGNGKSLLYGSLRGETGLVDPDSGDEIKKLPAHDGPVLALTKSTDNNLVVSGGGDGVIQVWSLEKGESVERYENPYGPVWALALQSDSKSLYFAGLDDFATLWQITPREPFEAPAGKFPRRFQATANMSLGERQFARKCSVCHTLLPEGGNRAGPTLYGLFGRRAGTVEGYAYSKALQNSDIIWNAKTVAALFEQGPDIFTPGSKMPLQKISDQKKRDALIAFLETAGKDKTAPAKEKLRETKEQ